MNKIYFLAPLILLGVIFGYERHFQRQRDFRDRAQAELVTAERARKEEIRQEQIATARRDTEKRAAEREKQETDKTDQKKRDYEALITTLQSQTDEHASEAAKINATIQELAGKVDVMRARQQAIDREAVELTRQIELKQADLRKAELGVQHTIGQVAKRLGDSL